MTEGGRLLCLSSAMWDCERVLQAYGECLTGAAWVARYEPFWDLNLPLMREGKAGGISGWFSGKASGAPSIQDCLQAYTADETMQACARVGPPEDALSGWGPAQAHGRDMV